MGILGKIEEWLENRKYREKEKRRKAFETRRASLTLIKKLCDKCGNNKMWYKEGKYKCTKCGNKIIL